MDLICKKCDHDCATCFESGKCETCPTNLVKGKTRCLPCRNDQYVTGDTCVDCLDKFDFCTSCNKKECLTCEAEFVLSEDGECICKPGFLLD